MNFFSVIFFIYLLCVLLLYYGVGKTYKAQNIILLLANVGFYATFDLKYLIALAGCILLTYFGAVFGENVKDDQKKKRLLKGILVANLLILIGFKYTSFLLENVKSICHLIHPDIVVAIPKFLMPIGLSFYIFQSSSYLLDLILGKRQVERDFCSYACYVSFFPTIVSGPILKSHQYLEKFRGRRNMDYRNLQLGFYHFLWGLFVKYMISDRIALMVNHVWENQKSCDGWILVIAAFAYSVQIYTDFLGYTNMAQGVAYSLGFRLPDNFRQPYFAVTIADFWRRWHMSLTGWFREYVYIPMGGNRKGKLRKFGNVAVVFLLSGIWHGASWNFVIWGLLHALYQMIGEITLPFRKKLSERLSVNRDTFGFTIYQRGMVFLMTSFAWIFFRAPDLDAAFSYLKHIFEKKNAFVLLNGTLNQIGLSNTEWHILWISLLMLLVVSVLRECKITTRFILRQNAVFRFMVGFLLFFSVLIYGIYGATYSANSFIYAGF